jgi:hypothetical protein
MPTFVGMIDKLRRLTARCSSTRSAFTVGVVDAGVDIENHSARAAHAETIVSLAPSSRLKDVSRSPAHVPSGQWQRF